MGKAPRASGDGGRKKGGKRFDVEKGDVLLSLNPDAHFLLRGNPRNPQFHALTAGELNEVLSHAADPQEMVKHRPIVVILHCRGLMRPD